MDDEDEAGQRLSNGSKQVPGPLPYFVSLSGGWRTSYSTRASRERQLGFGYGEAEEEEKKEEK